MYSPRNYEKVTEEAIDFADAAIRNGWLFDEYIRSAREAWIIKHEDLLSQAKYQVQKDIERSK
jgi:hypothetical protein